MKEIAITIDDFGTVSELINFIIACDDPSGRKFPSDPKLIGRLSEAAYRWLATEKPATVATVLEEQQEDGSVIYLLLRQSPPDLFTPERCAEIINASLLDPRLDDTVLTHWVLELVLFVGESGHDLGHIGELLDGNVWERVFAHYAKTRGTSTFLIPLIDASEHSDGLGLSALARHLDVKTLADCLRVSWNSRRVKPSDLYNLFLRHDATTEQAVRAKASEAFELLGDEFLQKMLRHESPQVIANYLPLLSPDSAAALGAVIP